LDAIVEIPAFSHPLLALLGKEMPFSLPRVELPNNKSNEYNQAKGREVNHWSKPFA
jgi:hypothetical protein